MALITSLTHLLREPGLNRHVEGLSLLEAKVLRQETFYFRIDRRILPAVVVPRCPENRQYLTRCFLFRGILANQIFQAGPEYGGNTPLAEGIRPYAITVQQ